MRLQFYVYRDLVSAPLAIKLAGENLSSYMSLHLTLWHFNWGVAVAKTYQCGECGDKVPLFCCCPRCDELLGW